MAIPSAKDVHILSFPVVNGITWTFGAIAIVIAFGSLAFRWRRNRRFGVDDYFNIIAAVLMIAFLGVSLKHLPFEQRTFLYTLGLNSEEPSAAELEWSVKMELATILTFWLALYAVKASVLALYWRPCSESPRMRITWWTSTCFSFSSFAITFVSAFWQCGSPSKLGDLEACMSINDSLGLSLLSLWCSLHVISSSLLLCLAIILLKTSAIVLGKVQKFGTIAMSTIFIIAIVLDIVRTIYSTRPELRGRSKTDVYVTLLEPPIAVITCVLPGYSCALPQRGMSIHRRDSKVNFAKDGDVRPPSVHIELEPITTASLGPIARERAMV